MAFFKNLISPRKSEQQKDGLKEGDFVFLNHEVVPVRRPPVKGPSSSSWGCYAGMFIVCDKSNNALVYVNRLQKQGDAKEEKLLKSLCKKTKSTLPLWMMRRLCVVPLSSLQRHEVREESDFPAGQLPITALVVVLSHLDVAEASFLSYVCKKFNSAFRDDTLWQRRTLQIVPASFSLATNSSWMDAYRNLTEWDIQIVTVFHHRGGNSISGTFTVRCTPKCTIAQFVALTRENPQNRQRMWKDFGEMSLRPHDASRVGRYQHVPGQGSHIVSESPDAKPNCAFNVEGKDLSTWTVEQAGLCNGAVLETPERMMCD